MAAAGAEVAGADIAGAGIAHEDPLLFEPRPLAEPKSSVVGDSADGRRAKGFAGAHTCFAGLDDIGGRTKLSVAVVWLDSPLDEGGPLVFFELQGFYYALGFSKAGDDLARWMKKKSNLTRVDCILDKLEMDKDLHMRLSRKQIVARIPHISEEELSTKYRIETTCSTRYVLAFLLLMLGSSKDSVRSAATELMRHVASIADFPVGARISLDNLPECLALGRRNGPCVHLSQFQRRMEKRFGDSWDCPQFFVDALCEAHLSETCNECLALHD